MTVLSHHHCACGYAASDPGELTDHLLEAFTPADDRGTDGLVHDETSPALTCACGYTAAGSNDLDAHFLDFTSHQSPVTSHQSPVASRQSPVEKISWCYMLCCQ